MIAHLADVKVAKPDARLLARGLAKGKYRLDECGQLEKRCAQCLEYWPADGEFFYSDSGKGDGLNRVCKACYVENRYPESRGSVGHQHYGGKQQ